MVRKIYGKPYAKVVYYTDSDILNESKQDDGDAFLADIFDPLN